MKIWKIRLQNGNFVYKAGNSLTKRDFHLQSGILELQTGLSLYISPISLSSIAIWDSIPTISDCFKKLIVISVKAVSYTHLTLPTIA